MASKKKIAVSFPSAAVLGGLTPSETPQQHPKAPFKPFAGQETGTDRYKKGNGEPITPTMEATNTMSNVSTDTSVFHGKDRNQGERPADWDKDQQKNNQVPQLSKGALYDIQAVMSAPGLHEDKKQDLIEAIVKKDIGPGFWMETAKIAVQGTVVALVVVGGFYLLSLLVAPAVPATGGELQAAA